MFPKPSYRCLNPACSEVLDYMDVIVDKRVKPCHDFYRHVCGHWLTKTSQTPTASSSSFMADVLRNYTARRHREMMAKTELAEPAGAVSRYYSHCVNYLAVPRSLQDIVNKVFEVSDTKALTWPGMSSDQIFSQLLRLSFVYRLHALFKITTGKIENKVYIGVNRCASFQQRLPKKANKDHSYLETVLKAVGGKNVTEAVIASCSALDDSIGLNGTHRSGSSTPLAPASNTDCAEFPPEKWVQGTSSQSELKLPNGTDVLARDFNGTCSDLRSVLLHEMPLVKALYPLALLVVNFLKLDFMHTAESKVDTELVQKICHQDTTATFKHIWLPSLTKVLSILPTTAQTVDDYYSAILNTTQQKASIFLKWMSDADRIVALSKVKELHITRFSNGSLSAEEVDNSRYNPSFGMRANDWIYNKLNVLRRTKLADDVDEDSTTPEDERFSERVEVQLLGGIETNTLVVPHMFAVPPLFFDVISRGSYANLATLGFQMARKVMSLLFRTSAGPWWSVEAASSYKAARTCYANYSGPFHGPLNDAEFDEAFQAAVALKVIFEAKSLLAEATPKSEAPFSSEELFFKRACLSLCAGAKPSQDINSLDNDTASAACTIAVSSMPEFHEAFACGGTDQMTQPLRCKI
ncbi:hypothetical protein V5799_017509 [Amblyomma americanum]|uniref:M13 family peptidase n=1 Tax=Amblyomma americanum TaxID=6943 RepID=A0AAQ4F230_AMBAM